MAPETDHDHLFSSFQSPTRSALLVAVSGGGDSLALLALAQRWTQHSSEPPRIVAATVDHGLRPDSARESAAVAEHCRRFGIEHLALKWRGPHPGSGVMAAARAARYRLLSDAALTIGSDLVLVGHTLDDQAETLWMRSQRSSGQADLGMAGIAPATLHRGAVWFARPLLGVPRSALRRLLISSGIGWIDDPTNTAPGFERTAARQAIASMDQAELQALLDAGTRAADARVDLSRTLAGAIERAVTMSAPGLIRIESDGIAGLSNDIRAGLLRVLLAVAGGRNHLPGMAETQDAWQRLGRERRATLARAVIHARRGAFFIHREDRDIPDCEQVTGRLLDGDLWDGRFAVSTSQIRKSGRAGAAHGTQPGESSASPAAPPALVAGAARAQPPGGTALQFRPVVAPWHLLLPCFDLAAARATARLIGAAMPPSSPLEEHNAATALSMPA